MVWFWYFLIYSFLGFLVEVAYVRLVGGVKRDRKCRLVLPICPVYGLGALAILLLPPLVQDSLPLLFPAAALVCTAVEYVTGLFYEKVFRVSFWDYSHLPLNLGGRVCLLFALFWGVPVSYTHLDVYKRQAIACPSLLTQKNAVYQNLVYCDHSTAGMRFASIPYRTIEKVVKIHRSPTCS